MEKDLEIRLAILKWSLGNERLVPINEITGIFDNKYTKKELNKNIEFLATSNYIHRDYLPNSQGVVCYIFYRVTAEGEKYLESLAETKKSKNIFYKFTRKWDVILANLIALASLIVAIIALSK